MRRNFFILWLLAGLCSCATRTATPPFVAEQPNAAYGTRGMVAAVNRHAADAGLRVLQQGGNAIDAAVAVGLTLGVVDGFNSGIGGGCFMLIHRADGTIIALDGREMAPAAAARDMYVRDGKADTNLSQTGALASGVPGALAVYEYAATNYGRLRFRDLVQPGVELAANGFAIEANYAGRLRGASKTLAQFPAARKIFFHLDGEPLKQGDVLVQKELANTYLGIAEQGSAYFYRGPFAQAVDKWMKANGGIMTADDLRNYRLRVREAIRTEYRGYEIISFPPPSSGGVHVAQMLNILENFNLKSMTDEQRAHVVAEAMKLAFADRAYWLGDPDFAPVPRGLVDKEYAATLAAKIRMDRAVKIESHGTPPDWRENLFEKHTTHFSVADEEGNWVACTATVNTTFGSKVVIPGTGVVMNNEMDDFSIQPGVPNAFGLIGAEANAVAPGKRPLSSMSPTIVLRRGKPVVAVGAAGGPTIITQVLQHLVSILDLEKNPVDALAAPRMHHQWFPDELRVERALPEDVRNSLAAKGHNLELTGGIGTSQIVTRSRDGRGFIGVGEPRVPGSAAGW